MRSNRLRGGWGVAFAAWAAVAGANADASGSETIPGETPQTAFAALVDGIRRCDESVLWSGMTDGSRAFVRRGLEGAATRDRSALEPLSVSERTFILAVRLGADGRSDVRRGPVSLFCRNGQPRAELAKLSLGPSMGSETHRVSPLLIDGRAVGLPVSMLRESGAWRLDLEQSATLLNGTLGIAALLGGVSEDAAITALLEGVTGRPIEDSLWLPLERRPGPSR